jgi:serine/threonine protein phosphatase 1
MKENMNQRLIAIGDIHGCFDPFSRLIEKTIRIRKEDRIILLGDYVDRGPKSREVIDYILDLRNSGYDIIALTGNHESMMLDSLHDEKTLYNWFMNGGNETLSSFGIESLNELDDKYLEFFNNLLYYYIQDRYIFVHAGFNDGIIDPFEDTFQMLWSRRESYMNPVFNEKIIVHGHTPIPFTVCREGVVLHNNVLNIDTGCVYDKFKGYGHLTALELYTMKLFSV